MKPNPSTFLKLTFLAAFCANLSTQAQMNLTSGSGTGPFTYTDPANWVGGIINNVITNPPASGLILQFTNDFILTNGVLVNFPGSSNVTFQSDSATPRTLHVSLGSWLRTNNNGGTITIGTVANPLIIDLYGSTRTIGGGTALSTSSGLICTNNINAQIVDLAGGTNGVVLGGGNIYANLLNNNNSFVGPVTFNSLRGGSFTSIKSIGAGASALGAPTDNTNALITASDGGSFGQLKYLGTGDTSDRPFNYVVTSYHTNQSWSGAFQFVNAGTGPLKLLGQCSFPTNRANFSEFIFNASTAPLQFDGYIMDKGISNTVICFLGGGTGNSATNRITLTGASNDFRDCLVSNVVLAFNNTASNGVPSALGAGTNITLGSGSAAGAGWTGNAGQGSSLQYVGTTNITFTRNLVLSGGVNACYWALDNAGTNTIVTWSNTISWSGPGAASQSLFPHYLYINCVSASTFSTNVVYSYIPDAGIVTGGTPIGTTVAVGNAVGSALNFSGGMVQLLNPTNNFAGGVQVAYGRTLQAATLADIGVPSSIGTAASGDFISIEGASVQFTGINLGSTDSTRGGIFSFIGTTNTSSNQRFTVFGPGFVNANVETISLRNDSTNNSSLHLTDTGNWNITPQGTGASTNSYLLTLGGTAKTTNTIDSVLTDVPNGSAGAYVASTGSLTVGGSAWRLTGTQTYSGNTLVAGGTLLVNGSIASGAAFNVGTNGVLAGTGTVNENVNVLTNGTVAAGDGGLGTLTINGNLTNNGSILVKLSPAGSTCDHIVGINTLAYGGTLVVSNFSGSYAANTSFHLFTAGSYTGSFVSVSPAAPGTGLAWDLTALPTTGTLKIVAAAIPTPPVISSATQTGTSLIINGTGGVTNGTYYVRSSTNAALAMTNWAYLSTNQFDGSGNFSVTNPWSLTVPQKYFRIQLQ